ncbi:MAG TPA: hypothetical protein VGV37_27670 [Aliidongia sp.]|uniref:hypothetical protein n=1 Tax=Aliidongia sp. TaxID=1914230 RepID=UPI002DDCB2A3|nr:hypothetical protein [Aliidongia sp.]HEV2678338.1 hypothetical protein [Aliidongia sp.]
MPFMLIIALSLHVLAAMFWAGSSFTLARTDGLGGERLFRPQMGAAVVAVLSGGYLWGQLHHGVFGTGEQILAAGALCAVIAAGVQGAIVGRAVRMLKTGADEASSRGRIAGAQRIASGLLAVTVVCMIAARFY